jgi:SAM-dependent methyltransferase
MYRQIAPFLGRSVLEAGCGIGNLTELLLDRDRLVASDHDPFYVEMIGRRFGHLENFRAIRVDLTRTEDWERLALSDESFDTILCSNVLEHIDRDETVLAHFQRALRPGGHAILLVPQHPWLYTPTDRTLGHVRRYTEAELRGKLEQAGLKVVHMQGFNRLGTIGWYLSGKILGRSDLSPGQMRTYNRVLPLARLVERFTSLPALSLIAVGRKAEAP